MMIWGMAYYCFTHISEYMNRLVNRQWSKTISTITLTSCVVEELFVSNQQKCCCCNCCKYPLIHTSLDAQLHLNLVSSAAVLSPRTSGVMTQVQLGDEARARDLASELHSSPCGRQGQQASTQPRPPDRDTSEPHSGRGSDE